MENDKSSCDRDRGLAQLPLQIYFVSSSWKLLRYGGVALAILTILWTRQHRSSEEETYLVLQQRAEIGDTSAHYEMVGSKAHRSCIGSGLCPFFWLSNIFSSSSVKIVITACAVY